MSPVLFTNVRIIDGSGSQPYVGEVLIQGNRISRISRGARSLPVSGVTLIDGAGATLMPGMVEAHTHFAWNNSATLDGIQVMPLEEHVLWTAGVARTYLDHGWTSCVGAATAKGNATIRAFQVKISAPFGRRLDNSTISKTDFAVGLAAFG